MLSFAFILHFFLLLLNRQTVYVFGTTDSTNPYNTHPFGIQFVEIISEIWFARKLEQIPMVCTPYTIYA